MCGTERANSNKDEIYERKKIDRKKMWSRCERSSFAF